MIGQNSQGCTLMIAHRLSTVKNCDRIVCLDKGHVLEQGTHAELLEINIEKDGAGKTVAGLYHDLWTSRWLRVKQRQQISRKLRRVK